MLAYWSLININERSLKVSAIGALLGGLGYAEKH